MAPSNKPAMPYSINQGCLQTGPQWQSGAAGPIPTGRHQNNAYVDSRSSQPQRVCTSCGTNQCPAKTWRTGPAGRQTLCNACGLRYSRRGAAKLNSRSAATIPAAPQVAAVPMAELCKDHPPLARASSTSSNDGVNSAASTLTAALPAASITTRNNSSSLSAAAAFVQSRPAQRYNSNASQQIMEPNNLRRSQRLKRPRVPYESLEPAKRTRAHQSSSAAAATAATGSNARNSRRQKRLRDASGHHLELQRLSKVTRSAELPSSAASAASGDVRQAVPATSSGLGAIQMSSAGLQGFGPGVHAEATRVLSIVAPGALGLRARKSYRVAERQARQAEGIRANIAAAAEAAEVAEILLSMAEWC